MRKINRLGYVAMTLISLQGVAQQTDFYTNKLHDFHHAVMLYNEEQFLAAQLLFEKVKDSSVAEDKEVEADCAYYIANCAVKLKQSGAEKKIEDFVKNYPTSSKRNKAYVEITDYFFSKGQYDKSLSYAVNVRSINSLSDKDRNKFLFQRGYSFFDAKNKKEAKKNLERIAKDSEWSTQAAYYLGYIAYETDNFEDAKRLFETIDVTGGENYKGKVGYYRADMSFKSGNFEDALKEGLKYIERSNQEAERSEVSKIIGESYFNLGQYDQALGYLEQYKGKEGKWSNTDFYQLGYIYYKKKDYENAIAQFNKIINGNDAVAQNAYYHLGESYLYAGKKLQALNAFRNASEMSFDKGIQEDSFLNYAKLSYEIGNAFESAPEVLHRFIAKYPSSGHKEEIETLLIDSYVTAKNYKAALALLEKNKEKDLLAYQKVTFYRGLELFLDKNYDEAERMFSQSMSVNQSLELVNRAKFWKAESLYNIRQYDKAQQLYESFKATPGVSNLKEFKNIDYALGYVYFKQKEYAKAIESFSRFVEMDSIESGRKIDAYLRLGDSNFVTGKYWPAMDAFNKVIEANSEDIEYAKFQKALAYGFVDRTERKIEDLIRFVELYPTSNLADDAQYELAATYAANQQSEKALDAFKRLRNDYPQSNYSTRALLRQGVIYYNQGNGVKALEAFKKVVDESPESSESLEAVQNARLVYVDNGRVEEYATWVKGLKFVEISDLQLDNDSFESAERQAAQNNRKEAISGYQRYLKNYPKGHNALQATYYLAQMNFEDNQHTTAKKYYENVLTFGKNEYTEIALARLSEYSLKDGSIEKAKEYLLRLEEEAVQEQNKTFAQANLMRIMYEEESYAEALQYAEKTLKNSKVDARVKNDASLLIARIALLQGNESKAKVAFEKLSKEATGEIAAESWYYNAYFLFKDKKHEASNAAVQKLAKDYSSYQYFGAKGLVLMAKNFYALNDSYQAIYILESVINNFGQFKDVVDEARKELSEIKKEEAKNNSSVSEK